MTSDTGTIRAEMDKAEGLADWCRALLTTRETAFEAHQAIARRLGAHLKDGVALFGFWTPELLDHRVPDGDVFLEILRPEDMPDLTVAHQEIRFSRVCLPVVRCDAHSFAAVSGLRAGRRVG